MTVSPLIFLASVAISIALGLFWEDVWKRYDARMKQIRDCIHETWDDPNKPEMGGFTRRCRKCAWQEQVNDDGDPF